MIKQCIKHISRAWFCSIPAATIFSIAMSLGAAIYPNNTFHDVVSSGSGITLWMLKGITYFLLAYGVLLIWGICSQNSKRKEVETEYSYWKIWQFPWLIMAIIFGSWMPVYLAYYPGILSYDIHGQTSEALGRRVMEKFHPPLHTLFWKGCIYLGVHCNILNNEYDSALFFYSMIQMLIMAACFTYAIFYLKSKHVSNGWLLVSLIYFAFSPIIAIFSFVPAKDAGAAPFFLMMLISALELLEQTKSGHVTKETNLRFIFFSVLASLLRHNTIYAFSAWGVIILIVFRKWWRKLLLPWVCVVLIFLGINNGGYSMLGIKDGNSREFLSIPIQQMAKMSMYEWDSFSVEDRDEIRPFIPVDDCHYLYNPRWADPVKYYFGTDAFNENSLEFFRVWAKWGIRYPDDYITAALAMSVQYWYPLADAVDPYSQRDYIETYIYSIDYFPVTRKSLCPEFLMFLEKIADYSLLREIPVVNWFCSLSAPFWLCLISIWYGVLHKKYIYLAAMGLVMIYWATYLLGPVCNLRYMLAIIVSYVIIIPLAFSQSKGNKSGAAKQ